MTPYVYILNNDHNYNPHYKEGSNRIYFTFKIKGWYEYYCIQFYILPVLISYHSKFVLKKKNQNNI